MSIYADRYVVDENTGETKLVKHLNKERVHRWTAKQRVGHWNKSGRNARIKKMWSKGDKKNEFKIIKEKLKVIE
jgi:hypothetical protein